MKERFNKNYIIVDMGKNIVSTGLSNILIITPHIMGVNKNNFCDSNGEKIKSKSFIRFYPPKNPEAFIVHYYTKTAEEFCQKLNKGDAHYNRKYKSYSKRLRNRIKDFFIINKITKEKIEIIENCTGINLNISIINQI